MPEDAKPNPAKDFLVRHGEKIALGVAAAALIGYLVFGVLRETPEAFAKGVDRKVHVLMADKNTAHEDLESMKVPPLPVSELRATESWKTITPAKATGSGSDWAGFITPKLKGNPTFEKPLAVARVELPTVSLDGTDAALNGVTVSWSVREISSDEQKKMKKDDEKDKKYNFFFPGLSSFTVEREVNGSGKWEKVAEKLDPKTTTYEDKKIEPRTKYAYRVTAYCDDSEFRTKTPSGQVKVLTSEPVVTKGIWNLRFIQVMKGLARIKIEKYDKGVGEVVNSISHNYYPGDRIGWWKDPEDSPEPISKHLISHKGKMIQVDFNSGMKLVSVESVEVKREITKCVPEIGPQGKTGCKKTKEPRTLAVTEAVYIDEMGQEQKFQDPNPKTHSRLQDELCEGHKQKPEDDPKQDPTAPPKEDPKTKADKAAMDLFAEAEKDEAENRKNEAAYKYRNKLLNGEYKDTDFVKKNRKIIEDRLKKLDEKPKNP